LQPFARLLEASGRVYPKALTFVSEVKTSLKDAAAIAREGDPAREGEGGDPMPPLRPLTEFHSDARYAGDLHRADMAWARHAADMGLSASEIRAAIMEARDLAKKGDERRQREYAQRTADKAFRQTK
jgi:hypothetical protein